MEERLYRIQEENEKFASKMQMISMNSESDQNQPIIQQGILKLQDLHKENLKRIESDLKEKYQISSRDAVENVMEKKASL